MLLGILYIMSCTISIVTSTCHLQLDTCTNCTPCSIDNGWLQSQRWAVCVGGVMWVAELDSFLGPYMWYGYWYHSSRWGALEFIPPAFNKICIVPYSCMTLWQCLTNFFPPKTKKCMKPCIETMGARPHKGADKAYGPPLLPYCHTHQPQHCLNPFALTCTMWSSQWSWYWC